MQSDYITSCPLDTYRVSDRNGNVVPPTGALHTTTHLYIKPRYPDWLCIILSVLLLVIFGHDRLGFPWMIWFVGCMGSSPFVVLLTAWGPWNDRHRPAMPNDRRAINVVRSGPSSKMVSRIGGFVSWCVLHKCVAERSQRNAHHVPATYHECPPPTRGCASPTRRGRAPTGRSASPTRRERVTDAPQRVADSLRARHQRAATRRPTLLSLCTIHALQVCAGILSQTGGVFCDVV